MAGFDSLKHVFEVKNAKNQISAPQWIHNIFIKSTNLLTYGEVVKIAGSTEINTEHVEHCVGKVRSFWTLKHCHICILP